MWDISSRMSEQGIIGRNLLERLRPEVRPAMVFFYTCTRFEAPSLVNCASQVLFENLPTLIMSLNCLWDVRMIPADTCRLILKVLKARGIQSEFFHQTLIRATAAIGVWGSGFRLGMQGQKCCRCG